MEILTPQAIKLIKLNGPLYGSICEEIGLAPASLRDLLRKNEDERLASAGVVRLIKDSLSEMQDMQIIASAQQATGKTSLLAVAIVVIITTVFTSCSINKPNGDYYWSQQQVDLRARNQAEKTAVKRIADSLYKAGDSTCFVKKVNGKWALACKDSTKIK